MTIKESIPKELYYEDWDDDYFEFYNYKREELIIDTIYIFYSIYHI